MATTPPDQYRLPSPSVPFIGRGAQIDRLTRLLREEWCAWLHGPPGVGRTELVVHTLYQRFHGLVSSTWYLDFEALGATLDTVLPRLLDRMTRPTEARLDYPDDLDALVATAEASSACIVFDGLGVDAAHALARRIAARARKSRWIVITRPTLVRGPAMRVPPLDPRWIRELTRSLHPRADAAMIARLARSAAGRPGRIPRPVSERGRATSPRAGTPSGTVDAAPGAATPAGTTTRQAHAAPNDSLISASPLVQLEHLRGLSLHSNVCALVGALDRVGERLLRSGYAAPLEELLHERRERDLLRWQLRAALDLGDTGLLRSITAPSFPSIDEALLLARRTLELADFHGAADQLQQVVERASAEARPDVALDARIDAARALSCADRHLEALAVLDQGAATRPADAQRMAIARATCLLHDGDLDGATGLAAAIDDAMPPRTHADDDAVHVALAALLLQVGWVRRATARLTPVLADPSLGEGAVGRSARLVQVCVLLERGDLTDAATLAGELEAAARRTTLYRLELAVVLCRVALFAHPLPGLLQRLREVSDDLARYAHPAWRAALEGIQHAVGALLSTPSSPPADLPARPTVHQLRAAARAWIRQARSGSATHDPPSMRVSRYEGSPPAVHGLESMARAERLRALGELHRALRVVCIAEERARATDHHLIRLELLHLRCELLLELAMWPELADAARTLHQEADACGSPRFALEGEFLEWAAGPGFPTPGRLEGLASSGAIAPIAARRAQSLLGGRPRLDAVDARLLGRLRRRTTWRQVATLRPAATSPAWQVGWGVDLLRSSVWLEDGRDVDLSSLRTLWRVLALLVDEGGTATQERIARVAWDIEVFHPLRHGSRLRNALWRLRQLVEDDPSSPTHIVTVDGGYALAGHVRVRRAAWQQSEPR